MWLQHYHNWRINPPVTLRPTKPIIVGQNSPLLMLKALLPRCSSWRASLRARSQKAINKQERTRQEHLRGRTVKSLLAISCA